MITRGSQPFFHPGLDHTVLPCPVLWGQIKTPTIHIGLSQALSPLFLPSPAPAPTRGLSDLAARTCTQTELVSPLTDDSCGRAWSLRALCLLLSQQETLGSLFGRCSELRDPGLLPFPEGHLPPPPSHRAVCVQTLSFMDWVSPCLTREEARPR